MSKDLDRYLSKALPEKQTGFSFYSGGWSAKSILFLADTYG